MKFSTKEDIEAPIEDVFAMLSEFEAFERSAIRRGVELQRVGTHVGPGVGMTWVANFPLRGKQRELRLELMQFDAPEAMRFQGMMQGLETDMTLALVALSPRRTRLSVELTLKPRSLPARLLVQSLKLAKANLDKKFKLRVAEYARALEERHKRTA